MTFPSELRQNFSPPLPLPEPVRGQDPGSFAQRTVRDRLPDLARLALKENDFPPDTVARLEALIVEINHGVVRRLDDPQAPDVADWDRYLDSAVGKTWFEIPWFLAEAYFFRRILEATGYFGTGAGRGRDPYLYEKQSGLEMGREAIRSLAGQVEGWKRQAGQDNQALAALLQAALWGNQADLSMWPVGEANRPSHASARQAQEHLLIDDSQEAAAVYLRPGDTQPGRRVDLLIDNAGLELACDLCLIDYLLWSQAAAEVHLHLRAHPLYVSDAMVQDVLTTVAFFNQDASPALRRLGTRLEGALSQGRLRLKDHFFWCSPLPAWQMPPRLAEDLAQAGLVISKGDANYRRLVGDRHWPATTPFEQVLAYFPTSLLALRIFKSEIAVGLRPGQAEALSRVDPGWMTAGRWGIIQLKR